MYAAGHRWGCWAAVNVFWASGGVPSEYSSIPHRMARLAQQRDRRHTNVDDPYSADVVLFPDCHLLQHDSHLRSFTHSSVARQFPEKVAVYDERDTTWCRLPGLYASMPANVFRPQWQVAAAYNMSSEFTLMLGDAPVPPESDLLFSFMGGTTHRCRKAVFALSDERAHLECTDGFLFHDENSDRFEERRRRFAEIVFRSKFVLCPRGHGTSSIRLFETLAAGRVPVIISDQWVPPSGPAWERFSIRWPESSIRDLPARLSELEPHAEAMGELARTAHEEWFAPDVVLTRQLDQLAALMSGDAYRRFPIHGDRKSKGYWWCGAVLRRGAHLGAQLSQPVARHLSASRS